MTETFWFLLGFITAVVLFSALSADLQRAFPQILPRQKNPGTKPMASKQLVFGIHNLDDAQRLSDEQNVESVNPCVNVYGRGPLEKMCRTCSHIKIRTFRRNYYKCDLRRDTRGPGTDHRLFWPSCSKYEEKKEA